MNPLLHVGFGNYLITSRIQLIASISSAPMTRMVQEAKRQHLLVDLTHGRKTKSVILMDSGVLVICSSTPDTLAERLRL